MRRLLYCLGGLAVLAAGYALVFGLIVALHRWPWPTFVAAVAGLLCLAVEGMRRP